MLLLELERDETVAIETLLGNVLATHPVLDDPSFLTAATVWSHELPQRLRQKINQWRLTEADDGVLLLRGLPIDDCRIGPTPPSLEALPVPSLTRREEAFLMIVAALLGDLIAWATQQSGRIVHDIFPIRSHQDLQLGTGCRQLLTWHTEDAFHPFRADYLAMFCLRNPQRVATTITTIDKIQLDRRTRQLLSEPHFTILPDESHRGITDIQAAEETARAGISDRLALPEKVPVFFGNRERPYWCLDPYFMPMPEEQEPREALQELIRQIDAHVVDIVLQPGDLCLMDNYRVVHGRRPFAAQFDGKDRWLKRVLVARDLRKSVAARSSANSRVIR